MKDFEKKYWDKNYSEPETMDGVYNAKKHAAYLKSVLDLDEFCPIKSIVDLGMGQGFLFLEFIKKLRPEKAIGIEVSKHAFNAAKKNLRNLDNVSLKILNSSIEEWCQSIRNSKEVYDLALCTSVFQYLSDEAIKEVITILAKKFKLIYFSVPTDIEQQNMKKDLNFVDEWAFERSQKQYLDLISPHFSIVSSRLLESKIHFNEETTFFTNLFFRL